MWAEGRESLTRSLGWELDFRRLRVRFHTQMHIKSACYRAEGVWIDNPMSYFRRQRPAIVAAQPALQFPLKPLLDAQGCARVHTCGATGG
jgi:hypothetical protein